jgi:multiple sugar transport system permease protein
MPRISTYQWQLLLMATPFLIGLGVLVIVPALLAAPLAFTSYDALTPPRPIGGDNFAEMSRDPQFWGGLGASLILVVVAVPLRLLGTLGLALLLQAPRRGFAFFRGAAYLPTIIPTVAYALLWVYIFNPLFGPLNGLSWLFVQPGGPAAGLNTPGPRPGVWLIDPHAAQAGVILMLLFTVGEGFVLLLAALREIPPELYEAAGIDGASRRQQVRQITLPLLVPSLLLLSLRDTVYCFQASFAAAVIVTKGGPYYATTYLPYWIYTNAVEFGRYGYAAALAWVLYAVTAAIIVAQFWITRRWREAAYAL